jgi:hypothetical protein
MNNVGQDGMWDEEDGFTTTFFDFPTESHPAKGAPMVGLLPLCATTVIEPWQRERGRGP